MLDPATVQHPAPAGALLDCWIQHPAAAGLLDVLLVMLGYF